MDLGDVLKSQYRIERSLGLHGARQRYIGQDLLSNERIVIETLHEAMVSDPNALMSLRYEIDLSEKLNGPNFASFLDSFTKDGHLYLVWKYIDGQVLSNNNSLKELTPRDVCKFVALTIQALKHAHKNGVIHGALSTDNILITSQLEPVIIGFSVPGSDPITDPGTLNGVSAYACAAPELFQGESIDESCDYYAIGIIAKFLFSLVDKTQTADSPVHKKTPAIAGLNTFEIDSARELIAGLIADQRDLRIQSAARIADDSFLDSMSTPPGGNEIINLSRKEIRQLKKGLKPTKPPRSDQTNILIAVSLRVLAIVTVAISVIIVVAKLTAQN